MPAENTQCALLQYIPVISVIVNGLGFFVAWKALTNGNKTLEIAAKSLGNGNKTLELAFESYKATHEWNRRKAAADINAGFLSPHLQVHWHRIYKKVLLDKKKYEELEDEEKESIRELLTYLEHVGSLVMNNIIHERIVFDLLGGLWTELYACAQNYIKDVREKRGNLIFEHVVSVQRKFQREHDATVEKLAKQAEDARATLHLKPLAEGGEALP